MERGVGTIRFLCTLNFFLNIKRLWKTQPGSKLKNKGHDENIAKYFSLRFHLIYESDATSDKLEQTLALTN